MHGLNLSALAVKHRAVTLFLILAILAAGIFSFGNWGAPKTRCSPSKS